MLRIVISLFMMLRVRLRFPNGYDTSCPAICEYCMHMMITPQVMCGRKYKKQPTRLDLSCEHFENKYQIKNPQYVQTSLF